MHVPEDADYGFFVQSDDGVRVYIDDKLLVDYWSNHGWIPGKHAQAKLAKGPHAVRIEHYNNSGPAALRVKWTGGGIPDNTVLGTPYVTKY